MRFKKWVSDYGWMFCVYAWIRHKNKIVKSILFVPWLPRGFVFGTRFSIFGLHIFFLLMTVSNNFWSVYSLRRSATTKESSNNQSGILLFNKFCIFYYGMCQQHRSYQPLHWLTAMYSVLWLMQTYIMLLALEENSFI